MEQADILIVNDNLEIQKIIQILLTGEGFRVTEAEDGEQALQNLKKVGFDLIILDIMMPVWMDIIPVQCKNKGQR